MDVEVVSVTIFCILLGGQGGCTNSMHTGEREGTHEERRYINRYFSADGSKAKLHKYVPPVWLWLRNLKVIYISEVPISIDIHLNRYFVGWSLAVSTLMYSLVSMIP